MSINFNAITHTQITDIVYAVIMIKGIKKATYYVTDRLVVKATRRHKFDGRDSRREAVITIGAPNYLEREFIKQAKRAGEKFPIKKIQLKYEPQRG